MSALENYIRLIDLFVTGEISASRFELAYLDLFKSETIAFPRAIFDILNDLFCYIDTFCSDPDTRDKDDLDDEDLRQRAKEALLRLT